MNTINYEPPELELEPPKLDTRSSSISTESYDTAGLLPPSPKAGRLVVVLDLDLTLIKMRRKNPTRDHQASPASFVISNAEIRVEWGYMNAWEQMDVTIRPGLYNFLGELSSFAEIIVWSMGCPEYVCGVLKRINKDGYISGFIALDPRTHWYVINPCGLNFRSWMTGHVQDGVKAGQPTLPLSPGHATPLRAEPLEVSRLGRNCSVDAEVMVKNLALLGRDLSRVVIVEDTELTCAKQPLNALIIPPFDDEEGTTSGDSVLINNVLPVLRQLQGTLDVRTLLPDLLDQNSNRGIRSPVISYQTVNVPYQPLYQPR